MIGGVFIGARDERAGRLTHLQKEQNVKIILKHKNMQKILFLHVLMCLKRQKLFFDVVLYQFSFCTILGG